MSLEATGLTRTDRVILGVALVWTIVVVVLALLHSGLSDENITRLAVVAVLSVDVAVAALRRRRWPVDRPDTAATLSPGTVLGRWVLPCTLRAAIVEVCHMPSRPLYDTLRWLPGDDATTRVTKAAVDVALTTPFYLLLFSILWLLLRRWQTPTWHAVLVLPLAQALGDGGAFFLANPAMLLLSPYVVLNYVACQLVPYLRVRGALPTAPPARRWQLALPVVIVPVVYFVGGALLITIGRSLGLRD